jgi:hypothetical protein
MNGFFSVARPRRCCDRSVAEAFGKAHVGDETKIVLPAIVRGVRRTYVFSGRTTTFTIKRLCVS